MNVVRCCTGEDQGRCDTPAVRTETRFIAPMRPGSSPKLALRLAQNGGGDIAKRSRTEHSPWERKCHNVPQSVPAHVVAMLMKRGRDLVFILQSKGTCIAREVVESQGEMAKKGGIVPEGTSFGTSHGDDSLGQCV